MLKPGVGRVTSGVGAGVSEGVSTGASEGVSTGLSAGGAEEVAVTVTVL